MTTTLSILDHSGDLTVTWDPADPVARDRARAEVARLKLAGYVFFLVDGSPADEVAAGGGTLLGRVADESTLIVRRIDADELVGPGEPGVGEPAIDEPAGTEVEAIEPPIAEAGKKRRGRPPKTPKADGADRRAIAVRPLAGG